MQNSNSDNQGQQQMQAQASSDLVGAAQQKTQEISDSAKNQLNNIAGEAQVQLDNLGKAGVGQMQNLGQEGVKQVSGVVNQFTTPLNPVNQQQQPQVSKDEKVYATISYIPFVAILSIIIKPDSAFVRLHARQGLLLTMIFLFSGIFAAIVTIFGIIGQLLAVLIGLIPLGCMVVGVYSMYLAMIGYWWKIPVLSVVSDLIPVEAMAKVSKENITGQVGIAKNDYDNRQETLSKETTEKTDLAQTAPTVTTNVQAKIDQDKVK